jgi:phage baseplate assembly protein V
VFHRAMIGRGIVTEIDETVPRVRVRFPDHDQMQSYWFGPPATNTQNNKDYALPDVGEAVTCIMDERMEEGWIMGSAWSTADTPPRTSKDKRYLDFSDGASFEYDRSLHKLTVNLPSVASIDITCAGAEISVDSSGNVKINGTTLELVAAGGPAVARVGDTVEVTNVQAGTSTVTGTIISGSTKATCA